MAEEAKEFEVLTFISCDQEMAFDVDYVENVIDRSDITPVPKAKNVINGVINLRGKIIPVIDLAKSLGGIQKNDDYKKIIIIQTDEVEAGFLVREVNGVLKVFPGDIDATFGEMDTYGKKAKGLIKKDKRLVVHLDVKKILEEIMVTEEV
jgi:purine-binding chemotaxis protein CheW